MSPLTSINEESPRHPLSTAQASSYHIYDTPYSSVEWSNQNYGCMSKSYPQPSRDYMNADVVNLHENYRERQVPLRSVSMRLDQPECIFDTQRDILVRSQSFSPHSTRPGMENTDENMSLSPSRDRASIRASSGPLALVDRGESQPGARMRISHGGHVKIGGADTENRKVCLPRNQPHYSYVSRLGATPYAVGDEPTYVNLRTERSGYLPPRTRSGFPPRSESPLQDRSNHFGTDAHSRMARPSGNFQRNDSGEGSTPEQRAESTPSGASECNPDSGIDSPRSGSQQSFRSQSQQSNHSDKRDGSWIPLTYSSLKVQTISNDEGSTGQREDSQAGRPSAHLNKCPKGPTGALPVTDSADANSKHANHVTPLSGEVVQRDPTRRQPASEDEVNDIIATATEASEMDHNAGAKAAIDFPKAWPTNPVNSTHKPKNNPGSNSTEKPKDKAEEEREAFFENLQRKYNYASFMDSKSADSSPTSLGSKSKKQERPTTLPTKKSPLGDDDPGMMSEAETSATGFRRGAKARSSLPIVRSPSKTLERPLGVVFLQFKNETKRALLPNEITSVDTVRALFVRAWPKKLTMEYLEDPNRCIYIHDFNTKDVFYELDDISDIKDRCLLRIHDRGSGDIEEPLQPPDDLNYFSEPEFDSNYQSQHVHKTSVARSQPYTVRAPVPQPPTSVSQSSGFYGQLQPRGAQAPAPPKPARAQQMPRTTPQGILPPPVTTQPQPVTQQYPTAASLPRGTAPSQTTAVWFESHGLQRPPAPQGYISPQRSGSRSGSVTPRIVDEEARFRVESMEKKLADLTGLVHTALTKGSLSPLEAPGSEVYSMEIVKEKSKSLPPGAKLDVNTAQQTTAVSGSGYATPQGQHVQYPFSRESLRNLHLRTQELKLEVKTLRRMTQAQAMNMKESIREVSDKIKNMLTVLPLNPDIPLRGDRKKIQQDQESYRQDVDMLEKVLRDLEGAVEELRSDVINRRCRVNMQDVESMAVALSHSSRAIADLKVRFPNLQDQLKTIMDAEMEVVVREEKFLKEEPDRLDNALKRCKRLTGTLFTLKRLASVQEQRAATTSSSAEAAKPDYRASNAQGDKFERNLELAQKALRDTQYMADTEHRLDRAISSLYERTGSSPSDYSPSFDPTRSKTPPRAGTSSDKDDHYSTVKRNLMSPRKDADTIAKVLVSDGSQKFVAATTSQGKDAGAATASQKPPSSLSSSSGSSFSDALVPNDKRKQPPPPPPRRSRSLTSPLLSPTGMLSPIKEMSPVSGPPGGFGALLDPSMSPTIDKSNISKHGRSQSEPEDFDYTPGRAAAAGGRAHEVIRINAITDDLYTRAPVSSNSSSSESINSQEGTPSKDAAHALSSSRTSRQEMLARKHEELIMKQQALQEQYSRLQKELQKGTALTPTHKVNGDARAQSPKPKTPSAGPADDAAAVATATTQKRTEMKIYETDIL